MRAVSRVKRGLLTVAAMALPATMAAAQQTAPASNQTTDTVGPRELQNFKLPGTVTRPADQPPAATAPADRPQAASPSETAPPLTQRRPQPAPRSSAATSGQPAVPDRRLGPAPRPKTAEPAALPPTQSPPTPDPLAPPVSTANNFSSSPPATLPQSSAPAVPLFAWLLAAVLAAAAGFFLLRRNRARHAYAGADMDDYAAPPADVPPAPEVQPSPPVLRREAASPAPFPTTAPPPVAPAAPVGIVSTRLRPWLEIGFSPIRCVLDEQRLTVDFEIELFNSGSAPARNVLLGATAFNAGPAQDEQIAAYFDQPNEHGHSVDSIAPLDRTVVPLQLVMPRDQLQPYEIGGHLAFVPLLAITANYVWSTGVGQSSASYLLGGGTQTDKLAPFRIDAGAKSYGNLAAKPLPQVVRR